MAHNILVTGGSGFIGSHLCQALVKDGHQVTNLDIAQPQKDNGSQYIAGDIRDPETVKAVVASKSIIIHLAAISSVPACESSPIEGYRTNILGMCTVAEAILAERRSGNPIRLAFASSAAVYGKSSQANNREQGAGLDVESFYAAQKFAGEQMLAHFFHAHKLPSMVFRFFNVFGPGQDPRSQYSGVISLFTDAVKNGNTIKLFGGGSQTRDFISVHDIVAAFRKAIMTPEHKWEARPLNLGQGKSVSILELANLIQQVAKKSVSVIEAPSRLGDIQHSSANIEQAKAVLNWLPETPLESGLAELL